MVVSIVLEQQKVVGVAVDTEVVEIVVVVVTVIIAAAAVVVIVVVAVVTVVVVVVFAERLWCLFQLLLHRLLAHWGGHWLRGQ